MAKRSKQEWVENLKLIERLLADCYESSSPLQSISKLVEGRLGSISSEFSLTLKIAPVVARASIEACQKKFIALIGLFDSLSIIRGDDARKQYVLIGKRISELYSDFKKIIEKYGDEEDVR